ncbi:MAG: SurA N-terminal domain-containing protein [Oceanicaulis sp.]
MLSAIRNFARSPWFGGMIIALLIAAFALWGVNDIFRGTGNAAVLVGPERVTVQELQRAYERQIFQIQRENPRFTREQADEIGLGERMVETLTVQAAIDAKAGELGLSLSDEQLMESLREIEAFENPFTNRFDPQTYLSILAENGYRGQTGARQFEAELAEELSRAQLVEAALGGVAAPQVFARARRAYEQERREIRALFLPPSLVGEVETPDDAALEAFISENAQVFQRPELRRFTLVRARPDLFERDVEVSEEDLQALYDFRRENGELSDPPTRTFTQWPAPDAASAEAAAARIAGGEDAGAVADDLGLGEPAPFTEVQAFEVPDSAIADMVFDMQRGDVRAVEGRLGWRVVRIDDALDPVVPSFEEVRSDLIEELAAGEADAMMLDALAEFEEARGAGATLEEAARAANLPAERFDFLSRSGQSVEGATAVTLVDAPEILGQVFELPIGFAGDLNQYGENGYFVVRVDEVEESRLPAVDEVRAQATAFYRARTVDDALGEILQGALDRVEAGESLEQVAASIPGARLETSTLTRGETAGPFNRQLVQTAFAAAPGEPFEARAGDQRTRAVAIVTDVTAPTGDPIQPERMQALSGELSDDLALALQNALLATYEVQADQRLIDLALGRTDPNAP